MSATPYFTVCGYKVPANECTSVASQVQAIVEVRDRHQLHTSCGDRSGPGARARQRAQGVPRDDFPELENVRLSDYRVSVVDAERGTGAQVRVLIQATDGDERWDAGCVSANIVDASFEALCSTR